MRFFLLSLALALLIWVFGFAGQQATRSNRFIAPRWMSILCLILRKDSRVVFEATLVQLFAYELVLLIALVRAFAPAENARVWVSLGALVCLVGTFVLLRLLLRR